MKKKKKYININWRFVTYDFDKKIDFSWEREWRLKTDNFNFDENEVRLIFPNKMWIKKFIDDHEKEFHDPDCVECYCKRNAKIFTYDEYTKESCEILAGDCFNQNDFPWILISLEVD